MSTLSANSSAFTTGKSNWSQILSLAFLNVAVVISWIAYHECQPDIMVQYSFNEQYSFLDIAKGFILVIIPPISGLVADYMIQKNGKRFIVFTVGASVTAMIFMSVSGLLNMDAMSSFKWIIPIMIVFWLISMNIFNSPANSMLDLFASSGQLPMAMAVITVLTDLVRAIEPVFKDLITAIENTGSFGRPAIFAGGGVALILASFLFLRATRSLRIAKPEETAQRNTVKNNFLLVFVVGLTMGVVTAFIINVIPALLHERMGAFEMIAWGGKYFSFLILIIAALLAIPISEIFVKRMGVAKILAIGLVLACIAICALCFVEMAEVSLAMCIVLGVAYSMISVCAFPLVLRNLSGRSITFGAGLFFGAHEIAGSVLDILLK